MPDSVEPRLRAARPDDAPAVAALHADSWQRHYRGAFSDAFLDGDVAGHLLARWSVRLTADTPHSCTIVAEDDGAIVGLAHTVFGEDPAWGSLLDNLHVVYGRKRNGIGTRLMAMTAQAVLDWSPSSGLYLWVLDAERRRPGLLPGEGRYISGSREVSAPGGELANLNGRPIGLRYAWRDPASLLLP